MKLLFISLFFVSLLNIQAQTIQEADVSIDFIISDNGTPPYNGSWEITFGLDSTATDGLDTHLGESYVPPDGCCGWGVGLCAAFELPTNPNSVWKDYRNATFPYSTTKEHLINYCARPSATVVTIQCNLPEGATGLLRDPITGNLIHIEMADSNEYIITNYIGLFDLRLTINYQTVIPVELTSFTSTFQNNSVNLNWQTATETNNSGFQIEKRKTIDERSEEWNTIGFVSGNGTTTEPKSYSFVDENLSTGIYKYRLKQIDYDGTVNYSNEIEFEITPVEFGLEQNYPNPFNPSTSIQYSIGSKQFVQLKIYDVLGNEIASIVNEEKPSGTYNVQFTMDNFSSGIYFYKLQAGGLVQTKRMLLLK